MVLSQKTYGTKLLMAVIGSFLIAPGMGLVSIGLIVILASWIIDKAGGTD